MILNSKILGDSGPSIIILHGLFGSLDNWHGVARNLSKNFTVHILDQRNHGKSFHNQTHTYMSMSEDISLYVKCHKLTNFHLIGHSMGGKTAMYFALKNPSYVNKLIIVDIAPKKYSNAHDSLISLLVSINQLNILSRKQVELVLQEHKIDPATIQFLLKNLYWINEKELKFRFNIDAINNSINHLMNFEFNGASWHGLTYFIKGEQSNYILDTDYAKIKQFFPSFKIIPINDSGHWVHFDQPNFFLDSIYKILN